jgi:hypothetical protein
MTETHPNPPRAAHALLRALVRPLDAEAIPGDLLEEYREVRRPSLGRLRADVWYVEHVLSMLWQVMWPCAVAIVALRLVTFPLPRGWSPSLVPAPGVSLLDAVLFVWAGYHGARRTGRLGTGIVVAAATSALGVAIVFVYAAVTRPSLLLAVFEKPFIVVIVTTLLSIAVLFGTVAGAVGAAAGRWLPPSARRERVSIGSL